MQYVPNALTIDSCTGTLLNCFTHSNSSIMVHYILKDYLELSCSYVDYYCILHLILHYWIFRVV
jgi:hypothetical protein